MEEPTIFWTKTIIDWVDHDRAVGEEKRVMGGYYIYHSSTNGEYGNQLQDDHGLANNYCFKTYKYDFLISI